ncbi:hypothetical protein JG688_00015139 [Phytophthora aleatoria]|uniref:RxLR effector protein n=1 Tax=Phytophthora aleatoria TaxID=2496075 RepID=A0A8J5IG63_9STRA|nr:hypothetical protein JG688_00015139 [Phytophthora aleatoria]
MRLSSILSVTIAIIYSVICSATADSDQTNLSMMRSPDLVRPLDPAQNVHATGRRFLRDKKRLERKSEASVCLISRTSSPPRSWPRQS